MPAALYDLASSQHGVVTRSQALAIGLKPTALDRRIAAGLLASVGTHCLRIPGVPPTWRQLLQVGVLDLGDAFVAGRAAAALHGLDGFPEGPLEYLVLRKRRARTTEGLVRSTSSVPLIDRVVVDGLPCTSAARTLIDGGASFTLRELEDGIDSALRLGLVSEHFLHRRLADLRHEGRRGVRQVDLALGGAGGHSRLERRFLQLVREAGLPAPTSQQIHRRRGQFIARTDFSWTSSRTIAEVAGHGTHASRSQRARDAERQARLTLLGWRVLTFTYEQVMFDPAYVISILTEALQAGNHPPIGEERA